MDGVPEGRYRFLFLAPGMYAVSAADVFSATSNEVVADFRGFDKVRVLLSGPRSGNPVVIRYVIPGVPAAAEGWLSRVTLESGASEALMDYIPGIGRIELADGGQRPITCIPDGRETVVFELGGK